MPPRQTLAKPCSTMQPGTARAARHSWLELTATWAISKRTMRTLLIFGYGAKLLPPKLLSIIVRIILTSITAHNNISLYAYCYHYHPLPTARYIVWSSAGAPSWKKTPEQDGGWIGTGSCIAIVNVFVRILVTFARHKVLSITWADWMILNVWGRRVKT